MRGWNRKIQLQVIKMVDLVISVCLILGPIAAMFIGFTLIGIAVGKINV